MFIAIIEVLAEKKGISLEEACQLLIDDCNDEETIKELRESL